LGFFLMDTFGPKPGPFGKPAESGPSGAARTPNQQACLLGRQVLLEGFKVWSSWIWLPLVDMTDVFCTYFMSIKLF
jgi:hypothetical protein